LGIGQTIHSLRRFHDDATSVAAELFGIVFGVFVCFYMCFSIVELSQ